MNMIHIVIPVYNVEKYLEEAVRSVLDQPYKGIDIVLVDDGSPDNSPAICDRLAKECDRVAVIHQENKGLPGARNTGMEYFLEKYSDGYIGFLDSDDMWNKNTIDISFADKMLSEWQEEIICFSSCRSNHDMTRFSYKVHQEERAVSPAYGEIWNAQNPHMGSKLYSLKLLRDWNLRFIPGQQYCEDIMFVYQSVFLAESIRYLSEVLYIYRSNPGGMMSNILKRKAIDHYGRVADGWMKSDEFLNSHFEKTGRRASVGGVLAGVYLLDMARYHYRQLGKPKELKEALCAHPQYEYFLKMDINDVSAQNVKDRDLFVKHHGAFRLKYNVIGIADRIARAIIGSGLLASRWEKRKFPLDCAE